MSLAKKKDLYENEKINISTYDLVRDITLLKKDEKYTFLKEVNTQSLQQVLIKNLDKAFKNFFRRVKNNDKEKGFPRFKSKHSKNQSFTCIQGVKLNFQYNKLTLPKIKNIKIKIDRKFEGIIKQAIISKTCTEKYFVAILVENHKDLPLKNKIEEKTSIGLDLGIKHFLTFDNGEKIENPNFLRKDLERLKIFQRRLSKKVKKSNNRNKQILIVARQHEKISNRRKDFLHKLSTNIIRNSENKTICIEDLNVSGMLKSHNLAMSIQDVSWSEFIRQLKYKAEWYGKNILQIGRFEASSKTCSCGHKNDDLKLSNRTWMCKECKAEHDRDVLAANNIKKFALEKHNVLQSGLEQPKVPVEMLSLDKSVKQEMSKDIVHIFGMCINDNI
jgi:putative transposase